MKAHQRKNGFNAKFARRLKVARESAGVKSAAQMAQLLGVEIYTYRTYERDEPGKNRVPPLHLLPRIAEILGVSVEWLVTGQENGKDSSDVGI